jgi:O-antigen ligase
MVFVTTVVLWARGRREVWIGAAVLAWLLAGIVTSFSQSSLAALLLGLAVLAAYRWNLRDTVLVCVAIAALAAVVVLVAPSHTHLGLGSSSHSANNATSGRYSLISNGLKLFSHRPLQGYGAGSFQSVYSDHYLSAGSDTATSASHTIPVTVAAEQGIVGLAVYMALLVVAFMTLLRGAARSPARIGLVAAFAALVLHTMVYADFLEDPVTWTLLAVGAALAAVPPPGRRAGEVPEPLAAPIPAGGEGEAPLATAPGAA